MGRLPCIGKAYQERSPIASAQETINLYAELNTEDAQAPSPITYYPTPGSTTYSVPSIAAAKARCTYRTSIGTAYVVVGPSVYFLAANGVLVFIGSIPDRSSQVIMADNGLALVLVDGVEGWAVDLATNAFGEIIDPAFYGADFVVFLDTFFVFNRPGTNQFYISLSMVNYSMLTGGTAFDPLDIAAKSGSADPIVGIATVHKELWLIGKLTTEVWIGTGAADFYFQLVQGAYIEHGCGASFSIATQDVIVFWLMQNKQGKNIILMGAGYQTQEISTPFLVDEFDSYDTVEDAIGFCFQIGDHAYYCITFPTASKTWLYDLTTKFWTRWVYLNGNTGNFERHRANCCMFVYGKVIVGDYENGNLLSLSNTVYTDSDNPIPRVKTFAHLVGGNFERISYNSFDADVQVGTQDPDIDTDPQIFLSWSDNRGITYGNKVGQSMGKGGEFLTTVSWNRLGMGRDRLFKLEWSEPIKTALNGGFIEAQPFRT